jgi:hypothetical protein
MGRRSLIAAFLRRRIRGKVRVVLAKTNADLEKLYALDQQGFPHQQEGLSNS